MFGKKKKEARVYVHPQFGEMKFCCGWVTSFTLKMSLWEKAYELPLLFFAESEDEEITPAQEEAFEKVERFITEQRSQMEEMAYPEEEGEIAVSDRILPLEV